MHALLIALLALTFTTHQAPADIPASTLTPDQVAAAIALGQGDKAIKAPRVGKRATLVRSAMAVEIGAVFNARLRIATAAQVAKAAYKPFTAADVTGELGGNYLLFVLPPMKSLDSELKTSLDTVLMLPKGSTDPAKAIRPLWTSTEATTLQNLFGATWVERTVFAAFPVDAVGKDMEVVAIYQEPTAMGGGPTKREIRAVVVDPIQ